MTDVSMGESVEKLTPPRRALEIVRECPDITGPQLGDRLRAEGYEVSTAYQNVLRSISRNKLADTADRGTKDGKKRGRKSKARVGQLPQQVERPDLMKALTTLRRHYTHQEVTDALNLLSGLRQ